MTKLEATIQRNAERNAALGLNNVTDLNLAISSGRIRQIMDEAERIQNEDLYQIAQQLVNKPDLKIVLLAGPSSSGKTSTINRLSMHLIKLGKMPVILSMDNWFVNRDQTPLDENGEKDFESLYAVDLEQLGKDMRGLFAGYEVSMPTYNFTTGKREYQGRMIQLRPENVVIMEGIHALNPILHQEVPPEKKHLIYASALTTLRIDDETRISTSENRLIRRLCRDYTTRGVSGESTLLRWQSVRRGEEKWIFPYQENADVFFNTTLIYELAALQPKAVHILQEVPFDSPARPEADRLLHFLSYFLPISNLDIPTDSILREFVGGSVFDVY